MRNKSEKATVVDIKKIAITTCLLTTFFPVFSRAADPKLVEANNRLQAIFKRIHHKYDQYDAQQAQLVVQAQAAEPIAPALSISRNFDGESSEQATTSPDTVNLSSPLAVAVSTPSTESMGNSRFSTGEELILSISLNALEAGSVFATKSEQGLQIALGDFLQIIEFPIQVNVDEVTAKGWFFNEENHFSLQRLADGRLEVNVKQTTFFIEAEAYDLQDDLFVELDDIVQWFDFNYQINEERLALQITSQQKFPAEARLSRLNRYNTAVVGTSKSVMPLQESDYKVFSPPLLDIQLSAQQSERILPDRSNPSDPDATVTDSQSNGSYSILSSHDLAYFNTELFLSGNDEDSLNNARLTMSRQSDSAELLGPLQATEYAFGDVVPVNAGFDSTQGLSRGFSLGNTPINQLADNRRVNITGEIQVGWDIELYQNGVLIDQRFGVSEGYYEFNDVPLNYGNNDFELMLYGPQGQIETKRESYIVDSNNVSAGQGMYRFSLVELGKSVFDLGQYADDPTQEGIMASTVLDYGVTDWLALNIGASTFEPKLGDSQQFYTLGANASLGQAGLLSARFLQNDDDLRSVDFSYRARLLDTSYSLGARRVEFFSPETQEKRESDQFSAMMSGRLFGGTRMPINYQNTWQRIEDEGEISNETFQNSIGIGSRIGYLSNSLVWQKAIAGNQPTIPNANVDDDTVLGSLQYRKSFGRLHTRLFGNYSVQPDSELTAYGGAFNYTLTENLNSELRYSYFTEADEYSVNLGVNWRKDAFTLSTNAGYNENGSWTAGLTLRFSLGYEPIQQSVFTSSRPLAQSGGVSVRVFEDLNMNGSFDENEPPIENATVKAVQAYRQSKTNESGVAVLSSLYNNTTTDIVVDESTLDGPFMITAIPGVAIKARKGYMDRVDFPVVKAGEVEGVIYLKEDSGESDAAPYININLIDAHQGVVATTRSEFDGYYLFTDIKPGQYRLAVDEYYLDNRGLKPSEKRVAFSSEGDVIAGVDFVLQSLDQAKGYVASAGHFDSANMLKLYYQILRNKSGGQFEQAPFFIKFPDGGGYTLGLAYFEGDEEMGVEAQRNAQKACTELAKKDIYCDVQYHDFKY